MVGVVYFHLDVALHTITVVEGEDPHTAILVDTTVDIDTVTMVPISEIVVFMNFGIGINTDITTLSRN